MTIVAHRLSADFKVQRFALAHEPGQLRLDFPHAEIDAFAGEVGGLRYGLAEVIFEGLSAHLSQTRWQAASATASKLQVTTDRVQLEVGRVDLPRGVMIVRGAHGVELVAPHASLSDVSVRLLGPFGGGGGGPDPAATGPIPVVPEPALRQSQLRFLDGVSGELALTLRAELDLPVLGKRTLDQKLRVPIRDGSFDFRALERGLDWLEGTFLDIGLVERRVSVSWSVPIVGSAREIVAWSLDDDAHTLATFDRMPLRALADMRRKAGRDVRPADPRKKGVLRSLALNAVELQVSMVAPRSLEVGGGAILFGGDDAPGIVDLLVAGALIHPDGQGALRGKIGAIDTTIKDLTVGGVTVTADRLHLGTVEQLEVAFTGFVPTGVTATIDRVTASNLVLALGA